MNAEEEHDGSSEGAEGVAETVRGAKAPDKVATALAMREAGYTVLSISQKLGISQRTLQRHFARAGARKGAIKAELVEAARVDLLRRIQSNDALAEEAARLIDDDLAHARHLRAVMLEASERLRATTLEEAAVVMRAAAAYSTAIKNTSDIVRHTLRLDETPDHQTAALPELIVRGLTEDEELEIRRRKVREAADDFDASDQVAQSWRDPGVQQEGLRGTVNVCVK